MKIGDKVRVVSVEKRLACPNDGPLFSGSDDFTGEVVTDVLHANLECTSCGQPLGNIPYVLLQYDKQGRKDITAFPTQDLEVVNEA